MQYPVIDQSINSCPYLVISSKFKFTNDFHWLTLTTYVIIFEFTAAGAHLQPLSPLFCTADSAARSCGP
jgi:hypothetical protein